LGLKTHPFPLGPLTMSGGLRAERNPLRNGAQPPTGARGAVQARRDKRSAPRRGWRGGLVQNVRKAGMVVENSLRSRRVRTLIADEALVCTARRRRRREKSCSALAIAVLELGDIHRDVARVVAGLARLIFECGAAASGAIVRRRRQGWAAGRR
jgi:hypothetical protein